MTGREFLAGLLRFYGSPNGDRGPGRPGPGLVELTKDKDRLIRGYSRGMRQRIKFAQAIAHDPELIILDEPLSGLDPLGKRKLIKLIKDYRDEGRTILVSSHVLPEIEALTSEVVLIHQGRVLAQGDVPYIRELIEGHPHQISVRSSDPRALAGRFIGDASISRNELRARWPDAGRRDPQPGRLFRPADGRGPRGRPHGRGDLVAGRQPPGRLRIPGGEVR